MSFKDVAFDMFVYTSAYNKPKCSAVIDLYDQIDTVNVNTQIFQRIPVDSDNSHERFTNLKIYTILQP